MSDSGDAEKFIGVKGKTCCRGGSRTAATSKMEHFVIKSSILDVAAILDPPLCCIQTLSMNIFCVQIAWNLVRVIY